MASDMHRGSDTERTIVKLKICLIGDPEVGKSSLVRRYVEDQFDNEYLKTVGAKVAKKSVVIPWNGTRVEVNMMLWDIAGERGFDSVLRREYLFGTQGVLAVCDATDRQSVTGVGDWVAAVRELVGDVPVQIVVNKSDVNGSPEPEWPVEGQLIHVSAKTGDNVERAFYELAKAIVLERIAMTEAQVER